MMDVIAFTIEFNRMCRYYDHNCGSCPRHDKGCCLPTSLPEKNAILYMKELAADVQKWSKEHPRKTRLMDFKEKYPNAPMQNNGLPQACGIKLGYCAFCRMDCKECWNEPLEDEENDKKAL